MQDRLHQPYRAHLIPGLEDVIEVALDSGAYGACLSGSGPTVLAFAPQERATTIASVMRTTFEARGVVAKSWALDVDLAGARVEPPEVAIVQPPVPVL
jgi:homoserine kinase